MIYPLKVPVPKSLENEFSINLQIIVTFQINISSKVMNLHSKFETLLYYK